MMANFEIVEAKRHHLGTMSRRLRGAQKTALINLGVNVHRDMLTAFENSGFRKAWLIDGKLAGLGGVIGSSLASSGFIWLCLTEEAAKFPIAMIKEARRQLGLISEIHRELKTTLAQGDDVAARFARHVGFVPAADRVPDGFASMSWNADAIAAPRPAPGNFVVFGLPRSRTRWLSAFLGHGKWTCHHDLPLYVVSVDEMLDTLRAPCTGSVETGLARAGRMIAEEIPDCRMAVVLRSVEDVRRSAATHGWAFPEGYLEEEGARLAEISKMPGVLTVQFDDLGSFEGCAAIYQHCLGAPLPRAWWEKMASQNIQIDMDARMQRLISRASSLSGIFADLDCRVSIQFEDFSTYFRDSAHLRLAHIEEIGPDEDIILDPNIEMIHMLEATGNLLIATARTPSEMVGYLVFVINPSLENRSLLLGFQNTFFVRKDYRGRIGPRLRKTCKRELWNRGVRFLMMKSGLRASGPRLKAVYEREGAKYMGSIYRLALEDKSWG